MSPRKDFQQIVDDWDVIQAIVHNISAKVSQIESYQARRHALLYEAVGFGSQLIPMTEGTPEYTKKIEQFEKLNAKIPEYDRRIPAAREDLRNIVSQYDKVCSTLMDRIGGIAVQMAQRAGDLGNEKLRLEKQIKTLKSAFGNPDGHVQIITDIKREAETQLNEPEAEEVEKLAKSYINLTEKKKTDLAAPDQKRLKKLKADLLSVKMKLHAKQLKYAGIRKKMGPLYKNIKSSIAVQKNMTSALRAVN